MHYIVFKKIAFVTIHSLDCIHCTTLYIFNTYVTTHCWQTDLPTDIVTYRAPITAKQLTVNPLYFKVQMLFWSWKKVCCYRAPIAAKKHMEPLKQMHSLLLWMLIVTYLFVWLHVFKNTKWLHQFCLPRYNPQKCSFSSPAPCPNPWEIRVTQFNVIERIFVLFN